MAERCYYKNIDWHVHVKGSPMGDIKFAFVCMGSDEPVDDLGMARSKRRSIDWSVIDVLRTSCRPSAAAKGSMSRR